MKKIYLIVSTYFPTPKEPWRCSFVYDFAQAICDNSDYTVIVLKPDFQGEYVFRGIRVVGFRQHSAGNWLCPALLNLRNISAMKQALSKGGIGMSDISVAHGNLVPMATYLWALKKANRNIRTVLHFHDADPLGMLFGSGRFGCLKKWSYFLYHRRLVEKMDALVGISNNVSRVVMEAPRQTVFNEYPPMVDAMRKLSFFRSANIRGVYTLHNGVNTRIFNCGDRSGKATSVFTIGCIGVFRDLKDQLTLLRAVDLLRNEIPDIRIRFVGVDHSGTMYKDCLDYIRERKLSAEILPSLPHEELPSFYRSIDLFVLPSYFEGFGCVYTESWNCGTPFMACLGQGVDDLFSPSEKCKWLVRAKDYQGLARAIKHYYDFREQQKLIGETDINILVSRFLKEFEFV